MAALPSSVTLEDCQDVNELLAKYSYGGFTYLEIKEYLTIHHDISISLSTIKRRLKKLKIFRRPLQGRRLNSVQVQQAVETEICSSGSTVGYRRIWAHLRSKGIVVRREDVRVALKVLDPEGVELRKKKRLRRRIYHAPGPNYVWHIDGHDKLKPFGFSIHGCIDGFSRRIIWLEVASTNKLPDLITKYYLDAVKHLNLKPGLVKADDGTEHASIEPVHVYLSELNGVPNPAKSFSIVSSPLNQRIESYWSKLRNDRIGWWRGFFQDMVDLDMLNPCDKVQIECIRYCFLYLLRKELQEIATQWNQHIISKSKNGGPSGRPDTMFFLPHLYDRSCHSENIDLQEVNSIYPHVTTYPSDYSDEFEEFANICLMQANIPPVTDPSSGLTKYMFLKRKIEENS